MNGREEFEKWAVSEGRSIKPASEYSPQVYASSASNNALDGWNARQPEVDALKAELKKLRCDIQTMGDALAEGVWASLLSLDDDLSHLDAGISRLVDKLLSLKAENDRLRKVAEEARKNQ